MIKTTFLKKGASIGASVLLLAAMTVTAQGNRIIQSKGQYAINSEEGNMLLDTDDIEANAQAIAGLRTQLGGLSFKYGSEKDVGVSDNSDKSYYWSQTPEGDWVKIGAVGNAVPSDVLNGKKFSSESGVDIDGTMPSPTSAMVTAAQNPSTMLSIGDTSVAINNGTDTTDDHDTNASHIDIGIGEQITIPHGYYNKDIVIANGVSDKGSTLKALAVAYVSNKNTAIPDGVYYDIKDALDSAYSTGYAQGVAKQSSTANVKVTYKVSHTHGSFCYPNASYSLHHWENFEDPDHTNQWRDVLHVSATCSVCGRSWSHDNNGNSKYGAGDEYAIAGFYGHLQGGKCPYGSIACGKTAGTRTTTDVTTLGAGDAVISATIEY